MPEDALYVDIHRNDPFLWVKLELGDKGDTLDKAVLALFHQRVFVDVQQGILHTLRVG